MNLRVTPAELEAFVQAAGDAKPATWAVGVLKAHVAAQTGHRFAERAPLPDNPPLLPGHRHTRGAVVAQQHIRGQRQVKYACGSADCDWISTWR